MSLQVVVDPERGPIAAGLTAFRPTAQFRQATDVPSYRQLDELLTSVIDLNVLLQRATAEAVGVFYRHRAEGTLVDDPSQVHDGEFSQAQENPRDLGDRMTAVAFPRSRPHRRRLITKEHLQNVAETYRLALQRGLAPTKHVAETFTVSHSTAARWVHLARKAGALGPATGKRPGEAVSGD